MCHLLPLSSDVAFKTTVNVIDNPTLVISSELERLVFKACRKVRGFTSQMDWYVVTPDTSELSYAFPPWLLWSAPVFMSEWNQISHVWFKSAFSFFRCEVFSRQTGWRSGFTITMWLFTKLKLPKYTWNEFSALSIIAGLFLQCFTCSLYCLLVRALLMVPGHSGAEAELRKGKAEERDITSPAGPWHHSSRDRKWGSWEARVQ